MVDSYRCDTHSGIRLMYRPGRATFSPGSCCRAGNIYQRRKSRPSQQLFHDNISRAGTAEGYVLDTRNEPRRLSRHRRRCWNSKISQKGGRVCAFCWRCAIYPPTDTAGQDATASCRLVHFIFVFAVNKSAIAAESLYAGRPISKADRITVVFNFAHTNVYLARSK